MDRFRGGGWLALVAMAAGAAVYWPVTGSFFHADDFLMLYAVADGRAAELLVTPHAGHLLLVRNAVFLLHHELFGAGPQGYYWTAYLTHLVNVALLFAVIRRATDSARLACAGATLWAVSPLNEGVLSWYAVYGHALVATGLLGALLCLLRIDDGAADPRRAGGLAALLLLLGASSFGAGIGLALAMVPAVGLLAPGPAARATRLWLRLLPLGLALIYVGLQVAYAWSTGHRHQSAGVALSVQQALLDVPLMTAALSAYGVAALLGGGRVLSLPEHGVLIAGGIVIVAVALLGARRDRAGRRLAACALLVLGAYGIVALGRVPTLEPLGATIAQGATWSRYHYAATAVIALGLCLAVSRIRLPPLAANGALVAGLAAIAVAAHRYPPPIDLHVAERAAVDRMRATVTKNVAAVAPAGPAHVHNRNFYPLNYIIDRHGFPGWAALYAIVFPANQVGGVAVRFVDTDPAVVTAARARSGTRMAELLVTRAEHRAAAGLPAPQK